MSSAVVVGGGVAGLAVARELLRHGVAVTVLEAGPRWGGKLSPVTVDGVRLDSGAESVLARRPEAVTLMDDLGLADRRVQPTDARSQVLVGGSVHALPPSAMGVPRDLDALEGYLSPAGLARARQEPDLPAPALAADVTIGGYVDQRFGPEVTDRLLDPLLGGVYAGRSRGLSFDAVAPALYARARAGGSLLEHARQLTGTTPSGAVFAGLSGGVSTLVDALVADLVDRGATLRTGVTVRELGRTASGYRLVCGPAPAPEVVEADAVVLATPAGPAGRLLAPFSAAAQGYAAIPYASLAVVTLVVDLPGLAGSGLLVPPGELASVKALTYSSNKWAWVAEQAAATWGPGVSVVRASVGRLGEEHLLQLDDEALTARTFAEAASVPGWAGARLRAGLVTRWGGALPQYQLGHRNLVDRLRESLGDWPGLAVCGAALDGVGVPACLASARSAALKVVADLDGRDRSDTDGRPSAAERLTTIEGPDDRVRPGSTPQDPERNSP